MNKEKDKDKSYFWIRIIISAIAAVAISCQLIFPELPIDEITIALLAIGILPWFSVFLKSFKIPWLGEAIFKDDKPEVDVVNIPVDKDSQEKVSEGKAKRGLEIEFQGIGSINIQGQITSSRLSIKARIKYAAEAGSAFIMKISVNDILIEGDRLLNKPMIKQYEDGRKRSWYDDERKTWNIQYSPDFESNYHHKRYKVVNGDPYCFVIEISDIVPKNNLYEVKVFHEGQKEEEAHWNPIIISDIEVY